MSEQFGYWIGDNASRIRVALMFPLLYLGLAGLSYGVWIESAMLLALALLLPGLNTPHRLVRTPVWTVRQLWYTLLQKRRVTETSIRQELVVMEARPWGWTEVRENRLARRESVGDKI